MSLNNPYVIPYPPPTNFNISTEAQGESIPAITYQSQSLLTTKQTAFIGRVNNPPQASTPLLVAGIPGTNYVGTTDVASVFYQGEDIIFDSFLYIDTQTIDLNRYTLHVVVKPTVYLVTSTWRGFVGNGIYPDLSNPNHFVIFIPKIDTSCLIAGDFELDVYAVEVASSQQDIKPRTLLVGKTYFNFEYAAMSPHPESLQFDTERDRALLPPSYPPFYNQTQNGSPVGPGSFAPLPNLIMYPS